MLHPEDFHAAARAVPLIERPTGEQAIRALRAILDAFDADPGIAPAFLAAHARVTLDLIAEKRERGSAGDGAPVWGGFDLEAPSPTFVGTLAEIATALSRLVRFNGWGPRFYSVAEHSILCDEIAKDAGLPVAFRRTVLMHDAAEAYCGDNIRPLKALIPDLERLEQGVAWAIAERFDLPLGFSAAPYDNTALAAELREFFPSARRDYLPDPGLWQPPRLDPDAAALEFLRRAEGLGIR